MVFCVCVVVVSSPLSFRDCHGVHGVHIPLDKGAFGNALVTHFHVATPCERRLSVPGPIQISDHGNEGNPLFLLLPRLCQDVEICQPSAGMRTCARIVLILLCAACYTSL